MEPSVSNTLAKHGFNKSVSILQKIFVEYLGLPGFLRLRFKKARKKLKELTIYDLWEGLLGPYSFKARECTLEDLLGLEQENHSLKDSPVKRTIFEGDAIGLSDVVLTDFVSISPGKHFISPKFDPFIHEYWRRLLTFSMIGKKKGIFQEETKESICVVQEFLERGEISDFLNQPAEFVQNDGKIMINMKSIPPYWGGLVVRFSSRLDRKLMFAIPNEHPGDHGIHRGFPILISIPAYRKIEEPIKKLGAVGIKRIYGILGQIPENMQKGIFWFGGIPRCALFVDSPANIIGIGEGKVRCTAWTCCNIKNGDLFWCEFNVGEEDFETQIIEATEYIKKRVGRQKPLFDFDEVVPRLYRAKFSPTMIWKIFESIIP